MTNPDGAAGVEQFGYKQELKRTLSYADLLIYGLIFMVPIAPFAIFGSVFQASGGMPALVYIVGAVAMMCTASSYAQMSRAYPVSGSVYTYVGRGIARPVGFVAGWMVLLDYILVPCLLYLAASMAMAGMVPQIPVWLWLVIFIVLNTVINYFGIEFTAFANRIMLVLELIVLGIFLVIGFVAVAQGKGNGFSFSAFFNADHFSFAAILGAVSIAVLSFLGFDAISTLAEEHSGPSKQIGRSMIFALLTVAVLFVVQTWVGAMLVPNPEKVISHGDPAGIAFYRAAETAGGHWMFILTAAATAVAWGFANALAAQAATSRLLFAMARDRQLPRFLSKVNERRRVPENATFLVAGISLVLGIWLTLQPNGLALISTLVNFGALTAFALLNIAVFWKFAIKEKSKRWWVHMALPIIGFLVIAGVMIEARPYAQIVGIVWLVIGVVVAILLARSGRMSDPTRESGAGAPASESEDQVNR